MRAASHQRLQTKSQPGRHSCSHQEAIPPLIWMNYSLCNLYTNLKMASQPRKLLEEVSANLYTKVRKPGSLFRFSSVRIKVSKQRTRPRLGHAVEKVSTPWTHLNMSKDQIRVLLKKHFYPESFST